MFNKLKPAWAQPDTYLKIYSNGVPIGEVKFNPIFNAVNTVVFPIATQSHVVDRCELTIGDQTFPVTTAGPANVPISAQLSVNLRIDK